MPIARSAYSGRSATVRQTLYSTTWPLTESPVSEGGVWRSGIDNDLTPMVSAGGLAFGTQDNDLTGYADSYALYTGFGVVTDMEVETTVRLASGYSPANTHEVENLLRGTDFASSRLWHETLWNTGGGFSPVYLNGEANNFTEMTTSLNNTTTPFDGARFRSRIVGNVIRCYIDDVEKVTCSDALIANITSGWPGIACFSRNSVVDANKWCHTATTLRVL